MKFEWDENKNQANIENHGISFRKASTVFSDENAVIADDVNHSFDDPLKNEIELDPKSFRKNPFAKLITPEQKLAMIISAAFEESKMTKDQFKKEVDMILA